MARPLRAGPVKALLDGRDLRYVRVGGVEVVRRLYVAVRDHNLDTIPGDLSDVAVEDAVLAEPVEISLWEKLS